MLGTFNNCAIQFYISIEGKEEKAFIPFEQVYGGNPFHLCQTLNCFSNTFHLIGIRNISYSWTELNQVKHNKKIEEKVVFSNFDATKGRTFEDCIENQLKNDYLNYDSLKQIYILCFLERYCLSYENVKEISDFKRPKQKEFI